MSPNLQDSYPEIVLLSAQNRRKKELLNTCIPILTWIDSELDSLLRNSGESLHAQVVLQRSSARQPKMASENEGGAPADREA